MSGVGGIRLRDDNADTFSPINSQGFPRPLTAASGQTVGEYHVVDRTGARSDDAFERESFFLKQAIEHAPRKRAVATATLERETYRLRSRLGRVPALQVIRLVHQSLSLLQQPT